MKKGLISFVLLTMLGTLFVLPNFYRNRWNTVEPAYYEEWQIRYDRLVIARLVKTRQDGLFSAGGFMGLGDETKWTSTSKSHKHQFDTYINNGEFQSYLVYRSNPGFQGILFGVIDKLLNIPGEQKLKVFRAFTALLSAMVFGLIFSAVTMEFGFLAGTLMLIFAALSTWTILPAGSIFWNLWAFYLPFVTSIYLLADSAKRGSYNAIKIYTLLFITTLLRILLSGFDIITAGLIMTTVPFVFYGIKENWTWNLFMNRCIKSGIAISAGALAGLIIMSAQIVVNDGNAGNAINYILSRFGSHAEGNSEIFTNVEIKPTKISAVEILEKYLNVSALTLRFGDTNISVLYWHLVAIFAVFTIIFLIWNRNPDRKQYPRKAIALIVSTWYSLMAPFSWYLLFRPHSIIHTHVNSMAWQMPFTLLGFALCGFVIANLLKRKPV